jgi:hypothetical protein
MSSRDEGLLAIDEKLEILQGKFRIGDMKVVGYQSVGEYIHLTSGV